MLIFLVKLIKPEVYVFRLYNEQHTSTCANKFCGDEFLYKWNPHIKYTNMYKGVCCILLHIRRSKS